MSDPQSYRELAEDAWRWPGLHLYDGQDGPWLPEVVRDEPATGPDVEPDRDSLYAGLAGLAPLLAEIRMTRPWTDAESDLAHRVVDRLRDQLATKQEASLYLGLGGDVVALWMLAPGFEELALSRLEALATPDGWRSSSGSGRSQGPRSRTSYSAAPAP